MKQHVKTVIYEFTPEQKASFLRFLAVLYFKKIKYELEDCEKGIRVVIPEDR